LKWNQVCNKIKNVLAAKQFHKSSTAFFAKSNMLENIRETKVVAANHRAFVRLRDIVT